MRQWLKLRLFAVEHREDWRWWVTPKPLKEKPIHRWYIFPHSFAGELVHALIKEWNLTQNDRILDPFAGAGTTVLAAKETGIPATGYDLCPLAVLATRVKIANYDIAHLKEKWACLRRRIDPTRWNGFTKNYPDLIRKALPGRKLGAFDMVDRTIGSLKATRTERDFFRLALLSLIPKYSRAVAEGGWLKWMDRRKSVSTLPTALAQHVGSMIADLEAVRLSRRLFWNVEAVDARSLPDEPATYSAVITSPPYPNRHDYTRVFGVELMFGFLDWEQTRQLRYQSFQSHPEAHPKRPGATRYLQPQHLVRAVTQVRSKERDPRVGKMLEGYFLDLYLALREVRRVCKRKARVAFVVGNVRYRGVPIAVDELTAEIGEQVGLICEKLLVARYRGNSAQQMGLYGRDPSRESLVVFRNP
jgi:hypothetical protein